MRFAAALNWEQEVSNDLLGFATATFQHIGSRFTQAVDQDASAVGTVTRIPIGDQPASTFTFEPRLGGYELVNFRFGVRKDNWEIAAYINNLFDENALLSLDRERGFRARVAYQTNSPRTFGLNLRTNF